MKMPIFGRPGEYRYWWPIEVEIPDPNIPGAWLKETFAIEFAGLNAGENLSRLKAGATEDDLIVCAARNWRDVVDETGSAVPYSEAALRVVLESPWHRHGIVASYMKSLRGA